jgi:Sulfotransferase family
MPVLSGLLPSNVDDVVGTLSRILRTRDPAAWAEVRRTAMAVLATPIDLVAGHFEQRIYARAPAPELPIIFVCGPGRSGTSVMAQVLIRQLPVTYFSNVVGLFPRSPLIATRIMSFALEQRRVSFRSFYGKSRGLSEPNDAMGIWDRWFPGDRNRLPDPPGTAALEAMKRFFGAWQEAWHTPIVAKNNRLYAYGEHVARALPMAHFICLVRDPVYLAQSQLLARQLLRGRLDEPYGILTPEYEAQSQRGRPAEDACAQVAADRAVAERTRASIGPSRFWMVSYERFCADPNALLERLSREVLGQPFTPLTDAERESIRVSARRILDEPLFAGVVSACEQLELLRDPGCYYL